jgi:hypothetical protein
MDVNTIIEIMDDKDDKDDKDKDEEDDKDKDKEEEYGCSLSYCDDNDELCGWLDDHEEKMRELEEDDVIDEDDEDNGVKDKDNKDKDNKDNEDDTIIDLVEDEVEIRLDASAVLSASSEVQEYLLKRMKYVYGMS